MAIRYDLTGTDILKMLGFTEKNGKEILDKLEKEKNIKLPKVLYDFLSLAIHNPLFETADIWTGARTNNLLPRFLYETIQECIDDMKGDWEDCPEEYADNEVYQFAQMPKEQWGERVADYLEIGSDYGAGVSVSGILKEDLVKEDPPVYMLIEEESFTDWWVYRETLSDFLMSILVDVFVCTEYNSAVYVSEDMGFEYYKFDALTDSEEKGIDLSLVRKYGSMYHEDEFYGCVYDDEEESLIFIGGNDEEDISFEIRKCEE